MVNDMLTRSAQSRGVAVARRMAVEWRTTDLPGTSSAGTAGQKTPPHGTERPSGVGTRSRSKLYSHWVDTVCSV